jgi:hypothetical protein
MRNAPEMGLDGLAQCEMIITCDNADTGKASLLEGFKSGCVSALLLRSERNWNRERCG